MKVNSIVYQIVCLFFWVFISINTHAKLYDIWLESALPQIKSMYKEKLSLSWPIKPNDLEQYSGFSTLRISPRLENSKGFDYGIHDAIDLVSLTGGNTAVFAPVDGFVFVLSSYDLDPNATDFSKDLWMFDKNSNAIIRMSHVKPGSTIQRPRTLYSVSRGDQVGLVAVTPQNLSGFYKPHVHLEVIEYGKQNLNPAIFIKGFVDKRPPKVHELIKRSDHSIIIGVSDRTNHGEYNGPPTILEVEVFIGNNRISYAKNCHIQEEIAKSEYNSPLPFLDIEKMSSEIVEDEYTGIASTELNPNHVYWIVLNKLSLDICDEIVNMDKLENDEPLRFYIKAIDSFGNIVEKILIH